jgi:hypothetical protein
MRRLGRKRKLFFIIPIAMLGMALLMALGGWIVMSLWNWLLPPLFGWKWITFWQALALLILCRLLFGGFGGHRSMRGGMRSRMRERMRERWEHMTPEERERFRQGMDWRCGHQPPPAEQQAK